MDNFQRAEKLRNVRKGEYIRLRNSTKAPVWVRGAYDKSTKLYTVQQFDDINRCAVRKGDTEVYVGFTF